MGLAVMKAAYFVIPNVVNVALNSALFVLCRVRGYMEGTGKKMMTRARGVLICAKVRHII